MQCTVNYWIGKAWQPEDPYAPNLLCRRCREIICLANPGIEHPLILKFEEHQAEMRSRKWEMRNELSDGQYPLSDVWTDCDADRISAEASKVHAFAIKYIANKHEEVQPHTNPILKNDKPKNPYFLGQVPSKSELVKYVELLAKNEPLARGDQMKFARQITEETKSECPNAKALNDNFRTHVNQKTIRRFETEKENRKTEKVESDLFQFVFHLP